ncbi:hypothetical protein E2C01_039772 [Portunus trituberculatus]|uniref:Uncharacterized protein n=1 Tax=Portunus trituberculatus TaxID=210409 RepID=A0A5B7FLL1_PORTR|nr:hypothetical protein [Portunus trituberculatus]
MSSCPSIFCHQHQVFLLYLFNAIHYLVHSFKLAVPFHSAFLYMLGPLVLAPSLQQSSKSVLIFLYFLLSLETTPQLHIPALDISCL